MIARASFPIPELVIGPDFDFFQPFDGLVEIPPRRDHADRSAMFFGQRFTLCGECDQGFQLAAQVHRYAGVMRTFGACDETHEVGVFFQPSFCQHIHQWDASEGPVVFGPAGHTVNVADQFSPGTRHQVGQRDFHRAFNLTGHADHPRAVIFAGGSLTQHGPVVGVAD